MGGGGEEGDTHTETERQTDRDTSSVKEKEEEKGEGKQEMKTELKENRRGAEVQTDRQQTHTVQSKLPASSPKSNPSRQEDYSGLG